MAEGLLSARLRHRRVDATVVSAGFLQGGMPIAPEGVKALKDYGAQPARAESRQLDQGLLDRADVVIGMTREHVRETAIHRPDVFPRTFTLKELARRAGEVGPRPADEAFGAWLERVAEGRSIDDYLGASLADDIADPVGQPYKVFKAKAKEIDDLLAQVVDLAWPA